jgi:hypothetical protein
VWILEYPSNAKCIYNLDDPTVSCERCRRLNKGCGSKHFTTDGPPLKRKRARKGSATPAAETPAATPAADIENHLVFLMTRLGLEDPRQAVETFIEHANAAMGEQLRVVGWSTGKAPESPSDIEMQQSPPPWLEHYSQAETDPRYSQLEQQRTMAGQPHPTINHKMAVDQSTSQPTGLDIYFENFSNHMSTSTLQPPTIVEPTSQPTIAHPDLMDDAESNPFFLAPFPPPAPRRGLALNTSNNILGPTYPGVIRVPCQ